MNGNTLGFHPQTQKLQSVYTVYRIMPFKSTTDDL